LKQKLTRSSILKQNFTVSQIVPRFFKCITNGTSVFYFYHKWFIFTQLFAYVWYCMFCNMLCNKVAVWNKTCIKVAVWNKTCIKIAFWNKTSQCHKWYLGFSNVSQMVPWFFTFYINGSYLNKIIAYVWYCMFCNMLCNKLAFWNKTCIKVAFWNKTSQCIKWYIDFLLLS